MRRKLIFGICALAVSAGLLYNNNSEVSDRDPKWDTSAHISASLLPMNKEIALTLTSPPNTILSPAPGEANFTLNETGVEEGLFRDIPFETSLVVEYAELPNGSFIVNIIADSSEISDTETNEATP